MPPGGSTRCEHSQRQADGRHARPVMAGSWSWSWGGPFALLQRCAQSSAAPLTVLPISMRMQRSPPKARREKRDHDTSGLCARPDSRDPGPCTPSSPCVVYCTNTCQDVVEADNLTKHPLSLLSRLGTRTNSLILPHSSCLSGREQADQQQTSSKPAANPQARPPRPLRLQHKPAGQRLQAAQHATQLTIAAAIRRWPRPPCCCFCIVSPQLQKEVHV
jgi:hypothetical protein